MLFAGRTSKQSSLSCARCCVGDTGRGQLTLRSKRLDQVRRGVRKCHLVDQVLSRIECRREASQKVDVRG